ncbi:MAG: 23S rRNA (adenine(2503)-C(2))-methyltransferase RlmN [Acholeplasmataceae bacterium]|nr:23S rRNA (adenine(2503)-C(2))-methyltransferase RlmN [Acholeplasmataceae bacterium]
MLIYDLTKEEIITFLKDNGYKKYRAEQLWHWLYIQKIQNFNEINNMPKEIIELVSKTYTLSALELVLKHESQDGTLKCLYSLHDGHLIESVLMRQHYGNSICVTTQVGCNIGCSFCASGQLKKKRDLTAGEIIAQVIQTELLLKERINYIVVMGIGEPFDNYDNLLKFFKTINDPKGLSIGARHITVSTSGIVDKIKEFAHFDMQVNLAISLHAPNNEIRTKLMKINQAFPIEDVIEAIKYYLKQTNRRVTIEYIMIDGLNDTPKVALELVQRLRGLNVYVNLIPYNEVLEAPYKRSEREAQLRFYDILKQHNIQVTLRKEQGHDINAACGQLRSQHL